MNCLCTTFHPHTWASSGTRLSDIGVYVCLKSWIWRTRFEVAFAWHCRLPGPPPKQLARAPRIGVAPSRAALGRRAAIGLIGQVVPILVPVFYDPIQTCSADVAWVADTLAGL
jgi:hypothetical protein